MNASGNVGFAILLTALAGLSTGIGSAIAFLARHTNKKLLCLSLGFSAGVMIYVSMIEIFVKARDSLENYYGSVSKIVLSQDNISNSYITVEYINK